MIDLLPNQMILTDHIYCVIAMLTDSTDCQLNLLGSFLFLIMRNTWMDNTQFFFQWRALIQKFRKMEYQTAYSLGPISGAQSSYSSSPDFSKLKVETEDLLFLPKCFKFWIFLQNHFTLFSRICLYATCLGLLILLSILGNMTACGNKM